MRFVGAAGPLKTLGFPVVSAGMGTAMARTRPDWYDDPFADAGQRYWDGHGWTGRTRPVSGRSQPWSDWALVAVVIAGVVGILAHTERPSLLLGLVLVGAIGVSLAAVARKAG